MALNPVIQLTHNGQLFTFRWDPEGPFSLAFWLVESEGRVYRSPTRVTGREQADLFRALANDALNEWERKPTP